jgi:sugar lactone lactonase YvrE
LEPGRYSGLAASQDGRIYLAESSGWRLQAYGPAGERLFEVSLPSARCLAGGGQIQGFCIADQTGAAFIRLDQNGERAFSATFSGHAIDAFYLAASGEAAILDAGQELVVFRDQGFRETRRWKLKGRGRPQSLAADMLDGLVAVAYPGEARLDFYSMFGVMLESLTLGLGPGPQTLSFDGQGRLWAVSAGSRAVALKRQGRRWAEAGSSEIPGLRALGPGPGGSVVALGDSGLFRMGTE